MLRTVDSLLEGFRKTESETLRKYAPEIEVILEQIKILKLFGNCIFEYARSDPEFLKRYTRSLTAGCECELIRTSAHTLFLSANALYRSAKGNIRYMLESILQSTYIDINHPNSNLSTKWEILKEVENRREYRAPNLINSWKTLDHKDDLQNEYKLLSEEVHPSHIHAKEIFKEVMVEAHIPAKIERSEIQKISNSLLRLYDIFYFLVLYNFPELKKVFVKNENIQKTIGKFGFRLLHLSLSKKTNQTKR